MTVPVNNRYTARELGYVLQDSDADFLVIHSDDSPVLEGVDRASTAIIEDRVIVVGERRGGPGHDWDELIDSAPAIFMPRERPSADDLLNIQFTSGTTGFPKGCMLTQRYWLTRQGQRFRDGRAYQRILASTPFYYMDPQWLLLMTFYQRAHALRRGAAEHQPVHGWLRDHRVQFCLFPSWSSSTRPQPDDEHKIDPRQRLRPVAQEVHAKLEERFDLVRARPSA